jgi:signal transduction histidine kinase
MAGIQAAARTPMTPLAPAAGTQEAAGTHAADTGPVSYVAIGEPPRSVVFQWISICACTVLFALVVAVAVSSLRPKPPLAIAETAALLAMGLGGIGWHILISRTRHRMDSRRSRTLTLIQLTAAGLAGIALIGPLNGAGYLIVVIAAGGLGMDLPIALAAPAVIFLFAGSNLVILVLPPLLSAATVVSNDVSVAFLFSVGAFVRSLRISQARARTEQARAEQLVIQLRAAQAAEAKTAILTERTHLAREVHDILAHSLTGLVLALDTAELIGRQNSSGRGGQEGDRQEGGRQEGAQARILEQVARAQRIARDGLADTRRAISALRGDELPGPALLDQLVRNTSETAGIDAALTVTGPERPLSPEAGLAVYRTAQEALINSAKYAGRGGRAELRLVYEADSVKLEIEDVRSPSRRPPRPSPSSQPPEPRPPEPRSPESRSPGLPSPELTEPPRSGNLTFGGYGLTGIRERAELLGGELTAGPTAHGFRVSLTLPACEKSGPSEPRRPDAIPREAGAV